MNKENFALKLVDRIILYYDARSKKHQIHLIVKVLFLLVNLRGNDSSRISASWFQNNYICTYKDIYS